MTKTTRLFVLALVLVSFVGSAFARFVGVDPAPVDPNNVHSFNRYTYANNNPYKFVDPDGRQAVLSVGAGILGIGTAFYALQSPAKQQEIAGRLQRALSNVFSSESAETQAGGGAADKPVHDIVVPGDKYPESAEHIRDAQANGKPEVLTIDRAGAKDRRKEAMKGNPVVSGHDRDEYPPAMTGEGGSGASVRPVSPSDNRGAGSCIGAQCRGLADGSRIRIIPQLPQQ